jgi:AcrR family transcriptional regulator
MGRWEPNARGRLEQAALALFGERGYEQTTAAEIAKRAGLTERTFFRHFADKREVLFAGRGALDELIVAALADVPATATPFDAAASALEATTAMFEERRDFARQRHAIVTANPELRERELIKLANLAGALAGALRGRGVADTAASLAAEVAITVFRVAFEHWAEDADQHDLTWHIRESLGELKAVTSA